MNYQQQRIDTIQGQIDAIECTHPKTEIRSRANGALIGHQCTRCGVLVGKWLRHDAVPDKDFIEPFDDELHEKFMQNAHELRKELLIVKRNAEKDNFDEWYQEYLQSPEWQSLRSKVFERCGNLCEGCRSSRATIVHHLTYRNVGHEFLFELVGLCYACHQKYHDLEAA